MSKQTEPLPLPERMPRRATFLDAYESDSVPGVLWYTFQDEEGHIGCTCRGYLVSKHQTCVHCETSVAHTEDIAKTA